MLVDRVSLRRLGEQLDRRLFLEFAMQRGACVNGEKGFKQSNGNRWTIRSD